MKKLSFFLFFLSIFEDGWCTLNIETPEGAKLSGDFYLEYI